MTTLLGVLEFKDYAIIATIVVIFAGSAAYTKGRDVNLQLLALPGSRASEKTRRPPQASRHRTASTSSVRHVPGGGAVGKSSYGKIAAIKLYRKQNPGVGLREAKDTIEAFYKRRHDGEGLSQAGAARLCRIW